MGYDYTLSKICKTECGNDEKTLIGWLRIYFQFNNRMEITKSFGVI